MRPDKGLNRELAIRRIFAEGLSCSPDSLRPKLTILGRWGDPAGMADASFLSECTLIERNTENSWYKEKCIELKYLVGYTILVIKNIIESCEKKLDFTYEESSKELDDKLSLLENYKCPNDCNKILSILDELINKYIFPEDGNKEEAHILDCCSKK